MKEFDCSACPDKSSCCQTGAWVDLEEARIIAGLGLKGEFHHLNKDDDFPSGYKVATNYDDGACTFLTKKGLCSIHKIDYKLKPTVCKEFPYEGGKIADDAEDLCPFFQREKI